MAIESLKGDTERDFTPYMQSVIGGVIEKIGGFYCREDFEAKIREVEQQKQRKRSGYASRLGELKRMCRACGMDWQLLCSEETYEAELLKAPSRNDLKKMLLSSLHEIYKEFPTPAQYMERVVRRRLKGEFEQDSVRLAIVKQFVRHTDYHTDSVIDWAKKHFSKEELAAFPGSDKKAQREMILSHLDETIFKRLSRGNTGLDISEWLPFLIKRMENDCGCGKKEEIRTLKETLAALPAGDTERETAKEQAGQVFQTIETAYCARLKQQTYVKKNGKTGTKDEVYKQAKKDFQKSHREDWELLKLADDLACGKFRVNGATKEELYIFAIAFGMTVYLGTEDSLYDAEKDMEKNLFCDYYHDNLLRYVLDEEYMDHSTYYESEPSGEGINYKNYVEAIYLYYIYRTDLALTPGERIAKAQSVIEKCAKKAKTNPKRLDSAPEERTFLYRQRLEQEVLQRRSADYRGIDSEDALVDYICSNYYVVSNTGYAIPRILMASGQNTVKAYHAGLVKQIQGEFPGVNIDEEFEHGIDVDGLLKEVEGDRDFMESVGFDRDFWMLLRKLDEKLHTRKKGILKLNRETGLSERDSFTRTEIITLYYCYFQYLVNEQEAMSLPELYQDFCDGLNPHLEECRYQPISEKNIFDMFVIFSLFLEELH